jgi:hypothetical protein
MVIVDKVDFRKVTCDDDRCTEVAQVSPHGKFDVDV